MIDSKRKAMIFLSIAFILAVITAGLVLSELRNAQSTIGQTQRVAVAKTDIATYTSISPDMVDWIEIPINNISSSFIQDVKEIENTIVLVNLRKGDLITANIIRSQMDIPENHRIVWLNATGNVLLDQEIAEGDLVDIIVSSSGENGLQTKREFKDVGVVQRQSKDGDPAIKISLPLEQAEQFIHYQNTAQQIRVLLVNQIQQSAASSIDQQDSNENDEDETDESTGND